MGYKCNLIVPTGGPAREAGAGRRVLTPPTPSRHVSRAPLADLEAVRRPELSVQVESHRGDGQLRAARRSKLRLDELGVLLHGHFRKEQLVTDPLVVVAPRDESDDLAPSSREIGDSGSGRRRANKGNAVRTVSR